MGHHNTTYWCKSCGIEFDPETENLRKESKIEPQGSDIEPAATSIQYNPVDDVEIRQ
jgi:hypothetical protein